MVGVPVLFMVWVGAFVPFVWVMVVGEGCSGWCCFQCWVAVVWASRRVPGVVLGFGVWVACLGVVWLVFGVGGVKACVAGLVCVSWFRMLTCLGLFPVFWLLSFVCFVNNAAWAGWVGLVRRAGCVVGGGVVLCGARFGFVWLLGCCPCCW